MPQKNSRCQDSGHSQSTGLKLLITNFYKSLFESHVGARFKELLNQVHQRVTTDMNNYLMEEYGDEEIKQALDSIGDLKAPGVDGVPALFYKQYWNIVGEDVVREVKNLLNGARCRRARMKQSLC